MTPCRLHQVPAGVGVRLLAEVVHQPGADCLGEVEGGGDEFGFVGDDAFVDAAGGHFGAGHYADADAEVGKGGL